MSLATVLLVLVTGTDPAPFSPPAARDLAAKTLRAALAETPDREPSLRDLVQAGRSASESLGDGFQGSTLARLVEDARWRGLFEADAARDELASALEGIATDLAFQPLIEAELPVGFPSPTPVGEIELKRYPAYRLARAAMGGGRTEGAFWKLFQHINSNKIAMTAPVEMTWSGDDETSMAFLYGTPEIGQTGSRGAVEVLDAEPAWAISIGCRGASSREAVLAARAALEAWLEQRPELLPAGEMRTLGYNSPMVPRERQYFEVQLPVRPDLVIDFADPDEAARWRPVNDSVMGGVSDSRFVTTDGASVFAGVVSLDNNGGFASVRADLAERIAGAQTLVLRFRGDGQTYKFRLRTTGVMGGVSYQASFETEQGVWTERAFPLDAFVPTWRGRRVVDAPRLEAANVRGVGFMISDEQVGPFRLELGTLSMR